MAEAANLRFARHVRRVFREMGKRRVAILVNPRGRDTESFVAEARRKVDDAVKMPSGYFIEWGGNFKNLQQAKARLAVLTPLVLVLVLGMISIAFRNVCETFLIFLLRAFGTGGRRPGSHAEPACPSASPRAWGSWRFPALPY
ncbi:MAG: efflux RND transporter permease subunit [Elusimicrobia bacterium]|nr:efflux RND transporter permease subunit [Elusimicrobiota bacterium]